ncbi:hypothetical protein TrVGV298_002276 [Trichoderma virens]|nr:hypothetical protein TrVGV298_002276 [Trichoderma virens]
MSATIPGDAKEVQEIMEYIHASYWQKNLESPVLFKSAVARIVEHFDNVAFLEVGPPGALTGPIKQLLAGSSTSAPYVDSAKLVANGACLSDLPRCPWDHEGEYWRESRVSHEWRQSEYPEHPLLGCGHLESSGLEPSWRKMIRVDSIPRVRDQKIEENVIFPAAGYISMVGKAAAQLGGHRNGYALPQVVINAAIVLNDGSDATEVVTNLCPHRLTDSLDSMWWEFTISSYNSNVWMKHCSGQVTFEVDEPEPVENLQLLPRRVPKRILYNCMDMAGLRFSPLFQRLSDVRTGTVQGQATANLIDLKIVDNEHYLLHPAVIDVALQLAPIAPFRGRIKSNLYRRVPTHINSLIVHRPVTKGDIALSTSAESSGGTGEVVSQKQQIVVGGRVTLHIDGLKISQLEDVETVSNESLQNTARFVWRPHLDFFDTANLVGPAIDWKLYNPTLNEITALCKVHSLRHLSDIQPALNHLIKYRAWIGNRKNRGSQVEVIGQDMRQIAVNIADVFSGKIDALEVLRTDDILNKIKLEMDAFLAQRTCAGVYLDLMTEKRSANAKSKQFHFETLHIGNWHADERQNRVMESIVEYYNQGHFTPIRPIQILDADSARESFRIMQQGAHLGKLVISLCHAVGRLKMDTKAVVAIKEPKLEQSVSHLWLAVSAVLDVPLLDAWLSVMRDDSSSSLAVLVIALRIVDFVPELESLGCAVELVKAFALAPNMKGIPQASMVLRDEAFSRMAYEDWNTATLPKVRGTWNLHEVTSQAGINPDFPILLSSMSGTTGMAGQANYAIANTFLDSFVQYRTALGLRASCIDLGAVQDAGYVANDKALLERMNLANTNGVSECELLEAIRRAIPSPPVKSESGGFVDNNTFVLGIFTTVPLGSQESRAFWKRTDIRKKLFMSCSSRKMISTSRPVLLTLSLDSLVGVETRSWWRQTIGFDFTVLEMLGMGTLGSLGWQAAQGLLKLYGEEAS